MWACDKYTVTFLLIFICYAVTYGSGVITNKIVKDVEKMRSSKSWNEESCLAEGGICIPTYDCPTDRLVPGLCPEQQRNGIDCCHSLPISETDCERRGGICRSKCPNSLVIPEATSCQHREVCCVLGH